MYIQSIQLLIVPVMETYSWAVQRVGGKEEIGARSGKNDLANNNDEKSREKSARYSMPIA